MQWIRTKQWQREKKNGKSRQTKKQTNKKSGMKQKEREKEVGGTRAERIYWDIHMMTSPDSSSNVFGNSVCWSLFVLMLL